jgi:hypothetical protein
MEAGMNMRDAVVQLQRAMDRLTGNAPKRASGAKARPKKPAGARSGSGKARSPVRSPGARKARNPGKARSTRSR